MKDVLLDANFPRDAQGRTYHVGTKAGQVANRIITVGDHVRARRVVESSFDGGQALFEFESQRNFLTLTGTVRGVPITVVAIGMGFSVSGSVKTRRARKEREELTASACGSSSTSSCASAPPSCRATSSLSVWAR